ncbi:cysteine hydrolase family protein [Acanthopleuribacter pedis]|uniref:Cysteine hydrolase n=1 Tax=Acanthopleuribacter pedis TaxID=442870 RepID=A0A8J7Q734_9BACT|nr:cysteine hydrolase family protein [Acanthopleuribacter pedis]MBO1321787.1 cysteine hydrolase [Acanthopleuribacter pedis]
MDRRALVLIDVQQGFEEPFWGPRNNPDAEANMQRILAHWREQGWPVFHVKHNSLSPKSPLHPDKPGNAFLPAVAPLPGEPVFEKTVNSGFIGTDLEARLKEAGITRLVIVGLTTDHCVSTTTRMAANLGFSVELVSDATATFDKTDHRGVYIPAETLHNVHLASLHEEFCIVKTTEQILG